MRLHYFVKLKIRVFVKTPTPEKRKLRILLIDFDFTYCKRCNFLTLALRYGKFNQENVYQTLLESASFYKRYDKTFWCAFRFTVSTAVHLQNANAKFHKVG